jgi:hypothetical protein
LSSHRFISSGFNGFLEPSLISTLLGDVMAATWVQKYANRDGFPSSNLVLLNSPGRNALEPIFSYFLTSLNFLTKQGSRRCVSQRKPGQTATQAPWADPTGPVGLPYFVGRFSFSCVPLFLNF